MKESSGNPEAVNQMSFHQGCPVCGRLLRIRVTLLGRRVYCQHCGGGFVAADSASAAGDRARDRRVEELIERADLSLQQVSDCRWNWAD